MESLLLLIVDSNIPVLGQKYSFKVIVFILIFLTTSSAVRMCNHKKNWHSPDREEIVCQLGQSDRPNSSHNPKLQEN